MEKYESPEMEIIYFEEGISTTGNPGGIPSGSGEHVII